MLTQPKTEPRPSIDDHDYVRADAGLHPEVYGRVDANGRRVIRCNYAPLAVTGTAEYQAALNLSIGFDNSAAQWNAIAGDFIEASKSIKRARPYSPAQEDLIESMAKAISAGVAQAINNRDADEIEHERMKTILSEMERPESERRRNDPGSNSSGVAILHAAHSAKSELIDRHGCCGGEPMSDGVCFGVGMCPRSVEITTCETFSKGVVKWAEEVNEQSALAAIAARLSVPSPVIDSEGSNV